jgi:type IV pilus assembly protein PilM
MGLFSKNCIGIDIGTSSIKVVELEKRKGAALTNYGILSSDYFADKAPITREKGTLSIAEPNICQALSSILKEAGIKSKQAFFAIPDFATFFTTFNLPPMSGQEVSDAVKYEAPRRIPLPLSEVTLDWQLIKGGPSSEGRTPLRILLVAVPNEVIAQYQRIAASAGLKLIALEAEVFALVRALVKYQDTGNIVCLIDIGERTTTINIVPQGTLKISYSFDIAGEDFTGALAKALSIEKKKAEIIKQMYGLRAEKPLIKKILQPLADSILKKTKSIFDELYLEDKERVGKVILTGGGATLPGFIDYFAQQLDLPIELANPFLDISYPSTLEGALKKLGPGFTIAAGMALRGFRK